MELEVAPLRSLGDFLQDSQFQVPDINRVDYGLIRVVNNLIYFQTNYFLCVLAMLVLFNFLHNQHMAIGIMLVCYSVFMCHDEVDDEDRKMTNWRQS